MPSRTLGQHDINTRIVPVQKAFSLFTRRSHRRPIHGFRLRRPSIVNQGAPSARADIPRARHDIRERLPDTGDLQCGLLLLQRLCNRADPNVADPIIGARIDGYARVLSNV